MGLRLYAIYKNFDDSITYTLEIHDNNFSGTSRAVDLVNGDVVLSFEGNEQDPFQWIVPTVMQFSILLSIQEHEDFANDLILSNEGRFWTRLMKGADVEFIGLLTADNSYIDDVSLVAKKVFSLTALDSISMLKDTPYRAAQSQSYILQNQNYKFRAKPFNPAVVLSTSLTDFLPYTAEEYDFGGHYSGVNGFQGVGRFDFEVYASIIGDCSAYIAQNGANVAFLTRHGIEGFAMTMRLYKIDINQDRVDLAEPVVLRFLMIDADDKVITSSRVTQSISAQDVTMVDGEKVFCSFSWDQDSNGSGIGSTGGALMQYTFEQDSYFENKVDSAVSVNIIHASVRDHLKNIFSQLRTRVYYPSGTTFLELYITHLESNQGATKPEDYIGIPYNAFVEDYGGTPPDVMSAYKALEYICMLLPGQLIYRNGRYRLQPFHEAAATHLYDKDLAYINAAARGFVDQPICLGRGQYTFLPPIKQLDLCFNKVTTKNLLNSAAAYFPTVTAFERWTSAPIVLEDRPYRLRVIIRVGTVIKTAALLALESQGKEWRHQFKAVLKVGNDYAKVDNINAFKQSTAVYSKPIYSNDSNNTVTLHGPLQKDGIKEHVIDLSFDLPAKPYQGVLEFGLEYDRTYVRDGADNYTTTILTALQWSLDTLRLSTLDAVDDYALYNATMCSRVYRDANSKSYTFEIPYSDLADSDQDPGAVKVWTGSAWATPGTFTGLTLHERITQWMANRLVKPAEILRARYRTPDYQYGHVRPQETKYMLLLTGRYSTKMMELEGAWMRYESDNLYATLHLATFQKTGNNAGASSTAINTVQNSTGGSTGGPSDDQGPEIKIEQYEYFTENETGSFLQLPATHRLPDPSGYSETQLMRLFNGSKRGQGNYVYRTVPTRPEHFTIDPINNRIILSRASTAEIEHFFMWSID